MTIELDLTQATPAELAVLARCLLQADDIVPSHAQATMRAMKAAGEQALFSEAARRHAGALPRTVYVAAGLEAIGTKELGALQRACERTANGWRTKAAGIAGFFDALGLAAAETLCLRFGFGAKGTLQ